MKAFSTISTKTTSLRNVITRLFSTRSYLLPEDIEYITTNITELNETESRYSMSNIFHNRNSFPENIRWEIDTKVDSVICDIANGVRNYHPWVASLEFLPHLPGKISGSEIYDVNELIPQGGLYPEGLEEIYQNTIGNLDQSTKQFILDCKDRIIDKETITDIIRTSLINKGPSILISSGSIVDLLGFRKKLQENIGEELNMQFMNLQFFLSSCFRHMIFDSKEKDQIIKNQALVMKCFFDVLGEKNIELVLVSHSHGGYIDLAAYLQLCRDMKNDGKIPPKIILHMLAGGTLPSEEFNNVIKYLISEDFIKNIDFTYYQYQNDPVVNYMLQQCPDFAAGIKNGQIKMQRFGEYVNSTKDHEPTIDFIIASALYYKHDHQIEKYLIEYRFVLELILEDLSYQQACYSLYKMAKALESKELKDASVLAQEALEGFNRLCLGQEKDETPDINKIIKYLHGMHKVMRLSEMLLTEEDIVSSFNKLTDNNLKVIKEVIIFIEKKAYDYEERLQNNKINGELTDLSDGLYQDVIEYNLELIKKSASNELIKEKLISVNDLDVRDNQKLYIINPEGINSKFSDTLKASLANANIINANVQRDNSTCSDHSLILLTKVLEANIVLSEIGITTVENEYGKHANLYIISNKDSDLSRDIDAIVNSYNQEAMVNNLEKIETDIDNKMEIINTENRLVLTEVSTMDIGALGITTQECYVSDL